MPESLPQVKLMVSAGKDDGEIERRPRLLQGDPFIWS
jgi:hypothetical protein